MHSSPSPGPPSHLPSMAGMMKGSPGEVVNGIQVSSAETHMGHQSHKHACTHSVFKEY